MSYFNLVKMPSPKGTNHEGWYIAKQSPLGPVMAMDTAMRKAKDADPEDAARRAVAVVMKALEAKLGDDDFAALCAKLCDEPEPEAEDDSDEPTGGEKKFTSPEAREQEQLDAPTKDKRAKDKKAKNSPPDFPGKPETKAMDSAATKSFEQMYPGVERVKPGTPGAAYGDRSSQAARNGATSQSFDRMFPDAAKVQVR